MDVLSDSHDNQDFDPLSHQSPSPNLSSRKGWGTRALDGPGRQTWVARQFGQPNAHTIAETLVNSSFERPRRMRSACLGTGMVAAVMLVGSASAQPLTIGLKAVQRNGTGFEPTGRLVVDPGNTIPYSAIDGARPV